MASLQTDVSSYITQVKSGIMPDLTGLDTSNPNAKALIQDAVTATVSDSKTQTSERLYSIQPRSAYGNYTNAAYDFRGDIASIRLINANNALEGLGNTDQRWVNSDLDPKSTAYSDLIGSTNQSKGYDRFLLTDVQVSYSEKVQIMTTFGDNEVVYYFGKNPVVMNLSGMLLDSLENNWLTDFIQLYQSFLRGSQLARNFEMLELVLPNMKVVGSILSLNHQQNAGRDTDIPFSMQFYAKEIVMLPQPSVGYVAPVSNNGITLFSNASRTSQGASASSVAVPSSTSINGQKYTTTGTTGGFSEPSWLSNPGVISSAANGLSTGYTWFRNNISSPVVSVIASLTKVIQVISKDITQIVSSFTDPLNAVLRDVTSIAIQGTAVAELVYNSAAGIGHILATPGINLRNTLASLKSTSGIICRLPESVSDVFKRNVNYGRINGGAAILSSGVASTRKTAVLNSGAPYTPQNSFSI